MSNIIDYSEVPFLDDILLYLPIEATDKEDISTYINNLTNLIAVNYKYEQYQFSYFGLHLLYMTYIYSTVWKISKINPKECAYASIFAKAYGNNSFDFCDVKSIFDYSKVPEKEIGRILEIIGFGQIGKITELVDDRNEMAHASGRIEILTQDNFRAKVNIMRDSIKNIHKSMDKQIRLWFKEILLMYCNNEFKDYIDVKDIIFEQMIQGFNLSINELLVCNEMSVRDIITNNRQFEESLKNFKEKLKDYCDNNGYV